MTQPETAATPPPAPRLRRGLRVSFWVAGSLLGLLLLLAGGALWWAGSQGSLQQALVMAQRFLPAGQTLEFEAVSGSITRGGSIGQLRWSNAGTTVTVEKLKLEWRLREVAQRRLNVQQLQAELVHVRLQAGFEEPPSEPFVMPESLQLPLQVTLPLNIASLQVERVAADGTSTGTAQFDTIAAGYRYDGEVHALALDSLHYGRSRAQAQARLHATKLDLNAAVAASLRDLRADLPFAMLAHAALEGTLAGGDDAGITVRLDAREEPGDAPVPAADSLLDSLAQLRTTLEDAAGETGNRAQVHVFATVHPWRSQPVEQLDLQLSRFNLAAFHTAAPATRIGGSALVQPAEAAEGTWDLVAALHNALPGRWDESRVPVSQVATRARLDPTHLRISEAQLVMAGPAPGGRVTLQGEVPLEQMDQARLQLTVQQLDLQQAQGQLPATNIGGTARLEPLARTASDTVAGWQADLDLRNAAAGPLDRERLPLDAAIARLVVTPQLWRAETLRLETGGGVLRLQGEYAPEARAVDVRGDLQHLPLRQIHRDLATDAASRLSGPLSVKGDLQRGLEFDADITSDAADAPADAPRAEWEIRRVSTRGRWSPARLVVERVNVDAMQARIEGSDIDVVLPGLDSIQARVHASAPGLSLQADAAMRQQSGGGKLALDVGSAAQTMAWLRDLPLVGGSLPPMQATGALALRAEWEGGWRQWADGFARPARYPQLRLDANLSTQDLALELPGEGDAGPTRIAVQAFSTAVQGNLAAASLVVDGDVQAGDTATNLDIRIAMTRGAGQGAAPRWQFNVEQLQAAAELPGQDGPWTLAVTEGLQVHLQTGNVLRLESTAGELVLSPPAQDVRGQPLQVTWEPLELSRTTDGATRVQSRGRIAGIQPGWLDTLRNEYDAGLLENAGLRTDLLLSGEWNVSLGDMLAVDAHIQRDSGDLWLLGPELRADPAPLQATPEDALAAGLRTIDLRVHSEGEEVSTSLQWESQRAGNITARVATELVEQGGGWRLLPSAPVSGNIKAHLQDLGMWGIFAPPGWRVQGTLDADVELTGTVEQPQARGGIQGNELNVRSVLDGVELHQGRLRATLGGQQLRIEELNFQGGTGSKAYVSGLSGNRTQPPSARGSMRVGGVVDWSGIAQDGADSGIRMDMQGRLERMQVLVRNDRQLSLSGDLSAALNEGALRVRGDLRVDRATILLPDAGAPTLGDDVIVVRDDDPLDLIEVTAGTGATGELETAQPMDLEIKLDLGRDLALHGHGITTRLEGELTVQSSGNPGQPFSVYGEVRTVEGRYRAWGQALNVETGIVAFNGSYLNPALNLLAIRPEIDVRAGVRVTGTLSAPRVELYSDPPLPEAEKLSWVVLGRATAIGGAEGSSMQRAALGLLAGTAVSGLADDLGVDELGLEESAVSIGKRVTDELYVTYEAGLSGAASTLYIFYDITRRFTIRGETGEATALDLIYTIEFD